MSRTWIIDGKAFIASRWRPFVHDSLRDLRTFMRDLNASLNDDGTVSVSGLKIGADGAITRTDYSSYLVDEHDPLYETNRGAAVGGTFSPDGFDRLVLESFELPESERIARFDTLYTDTVRGDREALFRSWTMIPDSAKLVYTLHLWERCLKGKLRADVWGGVLHLAWPHGKVGSMMFRAQLSEQDVVQMFKTAEKDSLMTDEDLDVFNALPKLLTAWRGVSSAARYKDRGFSWSLDRDRAEWFAYANASAGEPVLIEAKLKREAILMASTFEDELVVNPTVRPVTTSHTTLDKGVRDERLPTLRALLRHKEGVRSGSAEAAALLRFVAESALTHI